MDDLGVPPFKETPIFFFEIPPQNSRRRGFPLPFHFFLSGLSRQSQLPGLRLDVQCSIQCVRQATPRLTWKPADDGKNKGGSALQFRCWNSTQLTCFRICEFGSGSPRHQTEVHRCCFSKRNHKGPKTNKLLLLERTNDLVGIYHQQFQGTCLFTMVFHVFWAVSTAVKTRYIYIYIYMICWYSWLSFRYVYMI